jgi:methionyl-tRNA synthetase
LTPARYTVTSALPYANGPLHIGHVAGAYLPADIYVRYLRSCGKDVAYICGSDEHGAAITIQAKKEGSTPQAIVDKYHEINKKAFEEFGISFDIFHRTSSELHHKTAQDFFLQLYEENKFIKKETEQFYDEEAKHFLADRYITGTCPKCGNENAYGDQCEKCGSTLSPQELINPRSTLSGNKPVLKKTDHWFLPMNDYETWLKEWIVEGHKDDWKSNVYGQCKSWLESGLQARAMTRDLDWGVKVPLQEAEGKVLYVWLDAPIGYISATKQWAADNGKNWEDYWKKEDTRLLHFIGKDNIVFHCIIFPILLKAHGEFILPDNVPANEFLNLEGQKISTSRNWAVWLHEYLIDFPRKQDELRYVLCSISPEAKDSEFTWKDYQARVNNELVAIFGNFINRALVLTQKYFDNKVPAKRKLNADDEKLITELKLFPGKISASIDAFRFREALAELMNLARAGNKYLADNEPWKLIKEDKERVATILNLSLQIAANLAVLCEPFLPFTSKKLREILLIKNKNWSDTGADNLLEEGSHLGEAVLLYQKVEDAVIGAQVEKLSKSKQAIVNKTLAPIKDEIVYEDFQKLDIRTGTILEAEKVPKTDKLLRLLIDTGLDKRTVVSGIAGSYDPAAIIGRKVSILVNLAPRKIKGIESKGMILMAEDNNDDLSFISPDKDIEDGSVVR